MGAVLSVIIGVIGGITLGVFSAYNAAKNHRCENARKWEIYASAVYFSIAVIMLLIFLIEHAHRHKSTPPPA